MNPEQPDKQLGPLFPSYPEMISRSDRWFVVTNRANLLSILASGIICPGYCYGKYSDDLLKSAGSSIVLLKNGLDLVLMDLVTSRKESRFPVLMEISRNWIPEKEVECCDSTGEVFRELPDKASHAVAMKLKGALPVTAAIKIWFRTAVEKEDFLSRAFANVPFDAVSTDVDESLFNVSQEINAIKFIDFLSSSPAIDELKKIYRDADSMSGALALFLAALPADRIWLQKTEMLFRGTPTASEKSEKCSSCPKWFLRICEYLLRDDSQQECFSNTGIRLFSIALRIMIEMDPNSGWQAREVLKKISEQIREEELVPSAINEIGVWETTIREILENTREASSLQDSRQPEKRAILLLLLRPEAEDLLKARYSSLKPGNAVLALASILSGARTGFERLDNEFKSRSYTIITEIKSRFFNNSWCDSELRDVRSEEELVQLKVSHDNMSDKYIMSIGGRVVLEKTVEADLFMRIVKNRAEKAGYSMDYEPEKNRLSYRFEFKGKRQQVVYISRGRDNDQGDATVRFWSPCLDLSTKTGERRLTKNFLITLMKNNCADTLNCRFGLSDREKAVVVLVDQIVETLDDKEFRSHLESVAKIADRFEEIDGVDQY